MDRTSVSSSNLSSVGYDTSTATLEIKFHHGGIYRYYNVPESKVQGLFAASSKGRFFHYHIKNIYRYSRVGGF